MAYRMRREAMGLSVFVNDGDAASPARNTVQMPLMQGEKAVWLVRHGESEHNFNVDWGMRDPSLTQDGQKQARMLRHNPTLRDALSSHDKRVELIVASPLRRALQTAQNLADSLRAESGAAPTFVPFIAHPDMQELSDSPCDTGHPADVLALEFPEVDFSHVPNEWYDKRKEGNTTSAERINKFCHWLASRPEKRLICIGHYDFFHKLTGAKLENCGVAEFTFSHLGWKRQDKPRSKHSKLFPFLEVLVGGPIETPPQTAACTPKSIIAETKKHLVSPEALSKKHQKEAKLLNSAHRKRESSPRVNLAREIFTLITESRSDQTPKDGILRKHVSATMQSMGCDALQVEHFIAEISCHANRRKTLAELNLITADDFIDTLCENQFARLRGFLERKLPRLKEDLEASAMQAGTKAVPESEAAQATRISSVFTRPPSFAMGYFKRQQQSRQQSPAVTERGNENLTNVGLSLAPSRGYPPSPETTMSSRDTSLRGGKDEVSRKIFAEMSKDTLGLPPKAQSSRSVFAPAQHVSSNMKESVDVQRTPGYPEQKSDIATPAFPIRQNTIKDHRPPHLSLNSPAPKTAYATKSDHLSDQEPERPATAHAALQTNSAQISPPRNTKALSLVAVHASGTVPPSDNFANPRSSPKKSAPRNPSKSPSTSPQKRLQEFKESLEKESEAAREADVRTDVKIKELHSTTRDIEVLLARASRFQIAKRDAAKGEVRRLVALLTQREREKEILAKEIKMKDNRVQELSKALASAETEINRLRSRGAHGQHIRNNLVMQYPDKRGA